MNIMWLEKDELFPAVIEKFEKVDVVLDIGCGIMPQQYVRPLVHICCEPYDQYVEHLQEKTNEEYDRTYVVVKATWGEAVKLFPEKSVDTVFLVDVIEHLDKDEALTLLRATERIARRQVAIFTPLGFMPQHHPDGKDAWGLNGADWQEHKSGWLPEDFDDSWDVYASKVFHFLDSLGKELETPYGAMWVVRTVKEQNETPIKIKKEKLRDIFNLAIDRSTDTDLNLFIGLMSRLVRIKYSTLGVCIHKLFKKD